jgi:tetratricopeptide (TPR) repeat protein
MNQGVKVKIVWCWLFLIFCIHAAVKTVSNDSLYTVAKQEAYAKKYDDALLTIERILFRDPLHIDARLLEGHIYLWQNNYKMAQASLLEVIDRDPEIRDAWISLIHAYYLDGAMEVACSTSHKAEEYVGKFSVLQMQRQTVCRQNEDSNSRKGKKWNSFKCQKNEALLIKGAFGASLFSDSYQRYPWGYMDAGVTVNRSRWGIETNIHLQRRKYDTLTLYGAEFDCAPRCYLFPFLTTALRLSLSPYSIVDTIFPRTKIAIEASGHLPFEIEPFGSMQFRWYGSDFYPLYTLGVGKQLWNYFLSTELFIATYKRKGMVSCEALFRRQSKKSDRHFLQFGIEFGKSPFDDEKRITTYDCSFFIPERLRRLISSGYLSFIEGKVDVKIGINKHLSMQPALAIAGEKLFIETIFNETFTSPTHLKVTAMLTVEVIK